MDIRARVKFVGPPREALGTGESEMALPPSTTVTELVDRLQEAYPALRPYTRSFSMTVNPANVDMQTELHDGDEVACVPRVCGG
jgi:molybdopterin converting factor small subunit